MTMTNALDEGVFLPAPVVSRSLLEAIPWEEDLATPPRNKWEREYQAFLRMRPKLLETLQGKFVAVHEGVPVEVGEDPIAVALSAYGRYGYVPIYVGQVTTRRRLERMPSPREVSDERQP